MLTNRRLTIEEILRIAESLPKPGVLLVNARTILESQVARTIDTGANPFSVLQSLGPKELGMPVSDMCAEFHKAIGGQWKQYRESMDRLFGTS